VITGLRSSYLLPFDVLGCISSSSSSRTANVGYRRPGVCNSLWRVLLPWWSRRGLELMFLLLLRANHSSMIAVGVATVGSMVLVHRWPWWRMPTMIHTRWGFGVNGCGTRGLRFQSRRRCRWRSLIVRDAVLINDGGCGRYGHGKAAMSALVRGVQ
jgi:hypothetical protein